MSSVWDSDFAEHAPWERFAEHPRGSLFWKMGLGESYLDAWTIWFLAMSEVERDEYLRVHQLPNSWSNMIQRLRSEDA